MRLSAATLSTAAAALLAACAAMPPAPLKAAAAIEAKNGSTVTGRVDLTESGGRLRAHVELAGLPPNSEHGFHVHEKGDCSGADAAGAGGHFNPGGTAHGRAGSAAHHAGDLPSLTADAHGSVRADLLLEGVTLAAGPTSIVGRSFVLHRDRDDFATQPSGNSGPKIACGVIAAQ
jgi:Cu-Zn family superoxide dismutase